MCTNELKSTKAITLISLVVTIVVLLIFAGVSILTLAGDTGLLNRATSAKQKTEEAGVIEDIKLAYTSAQIGKYSGKNEDISEQMETELAQKYSNPTVTVEEETYIVSINGKSYQVSGTGEVSELRPTLNISEFTLVDSEDNELNEEIPLGTSAYIRFTVSGGTDIVVKDSLEKVITLEDGYYKKAITQNGTYSFTVTGKVSGENVSLSSQKTVTNYTIIGAVVRYSSSGKFYDWGPQYATSYKSGSTDYNNAKKKLSAANMSIQYWKILELKNNTVKMVPATLDYCDNEANKVTLHGAQGYNNAVNLLDEACDALYSDSIKGIKAENIGIDDIEKIMDEAKIDTNSDDEELDWRAKRKSFSLGNVVYNNQNEGEYSSLYLYNKYPVLYSQEKLKAIGNPYIPATTGLDLYGKSEAKIERSEGTSTNKVIGAIDGADIKPVQTYYALENSDFSDYLGTLYSKILLPNGTDTEYWVASRFALTTSGYYRFGVRNISGGGLYGNEVFSGEGYEYSPAHSLFPVVTLNYGLLKTPSEGITSFQFYVE